MDFQEDLGVRNILLECGDPFPLDESLDSAVVVLDSQYRIRFNHSLRVC